MNGAKPSDWTLPNKKESKRLAEKWDVPPEELLELYLRSLMVDPDFQALILSKESKRRNRADSPAKCISMLLLLLAGAGSRGLQAGVITWRMCKHRECLQKDCTPKGCQRSDHLRRAIVKGNNSPKVLRWLKELSEIGLLERYEANRRVVYYRIAPRSRFKFHLSGESVDDILVNYPKFTETLDNKQCREFLVLLSRRLVAAQHLLLEKHLDDPNAAIDEKCQQLSDNPCKLPTFFIGTSKQQVERLV